MFKRAVLLGINFVSTLILASSFVAVAQDKKLTADEIVGRHLASFGPAEAITKSVNRMAVGQANFTMLTTQKTASGNAVLASDGKNLALFSTFDMRDYRMERIGLFSNKVTVPIVEQGHRSPLGEFLSAYDKFLGQRLFGGTIFSTWFLFYPDLGGVSIDVDGRKKAGNVEAWVLKVVPKGGLGTGSYIKMYFDAKDFHHIRTVYRQAETERGFYSTMNDKSAKGQAPGGWDNDMSNNGSTLTEDFSDFKPDAAGIMLPHKYSLLLSINGVQSSAEFKYQFDINEYKLIKEFPANFFSFQAQIP